MELIALIKALLALKEPCRVEIVSDSKYLLAAFRKKWIPKWKRNGWRTASRQPVLNRDLWQELDGLSATHKPHYRWVKGHCLTPENNRCDELAAAAANSESLLIDEGSNALLGCASVAWANSRGFGPAVLLLRQRRRERGESREPHHHSILSIAKQ